MVGGIIETDLNVVYYNYTTIIDVIKLFSCLSKKYDGEFGK